MADTKNLLESVKEMVQSCIQCGTCTGSCPNEFAMDFTPRTLWRMVLMDQYNMIFHSTSFALCSDCFNCTLRCPRGLPLTEAMEALKQIAVKENVYAYKTSRIFYKNFLESVRKHGRVNEMEFMTLYFLDMKNPMLPLQFTRIGLKLMKKKKVKLQIPAKEQVLADLFRKVEILEEQA